MTKEMEFAKYTIARNKLMDRFLIIREDDPKAA